MIIKIIRQKRSKLNDHSIINYKSIYYEVIMSLNKRYIYIYFIHNLKCWQTNYNWVAITRLRSCLHYFASILIFITPFLALKWVSKNFYNYFLSLIQWIIFQFHFWFKIDVLRWVWFNKYFKFTYNPLLFLHDRSSYCSIHHI